jgi:hypothetical protein
MKLARFTFICAGVWGIAVLTPFYWLVDLTGRRYDPPATYPHFFYGFVAVALAWQIAFLMIGSNPLRFRTLMIPAVIEKFGFVSTLAVLYGQGRIAPVDAQAAVPDALLGLLFILSFVRTRSVSVTGIPRQSDMTLVRADPRS